jgi:hypothetical protein
MSIFLKGLVAQPALLNVRSVATARTLRPHQPGQTRRVSGTQKGRPFMNMRFVRSSTLSTIAALLALAMTSSAAAQSVQVPPVGPSGPVWEIVPPGPYFTNPSPKVGETYTLNIPVRVNRNARRNLTIVAAVTSLPRGDSLISAGTQRVTLAPNGQTYTFRFVIRCGVVGGSVRYSVDAKIP